MYNYCRKINILTYLQIVCFNFSGWEVFRERVQKSRSLKTVAEALGKNPDPDGDAGINPSDSFEPESTPTGHTTRRKTLTSAPAA